MYNIRLNSIYSDENNYHFDIKKYWRSFELKEGYNMSKEFDRYPHMGFRIIESDTFKNELCDDYVKKIIYIYKVNIPDDATINFNCNQGHFYTNKVFLNKRTVLCLT